MELFKRNEQASLIRHLSNLHEEQNSWRLAELTLPAQEDTAFTVDSVAQLLMAVFAGYHGLIYLQSHRELRLLIRWPVSESLNTLAQRIRQRLPDTACAVHVHPPTENSVNTLQQQLQQKQGKPMMQPHRILIADDDLYVRTIVKKGLGPAFTVYEVTEGQAVLHAYVQYKPDILFLDIHLPGRAGPKILSEVMALDPNAYIIMLSADSSEENVLQTIKLGAKSFLTKPFSKDKLMEQVNRCPTIGKDPV